MKSVAHLPWRQLTYKFLNTIIDDLFAFVIKMPLLHRLSVFRDDVVFLIYLYQRWIYRVDTKRANEFGCARPEECMDLMYAAGRADEGLVAVVLCCGLQMPGPPRASTFLSVGVWYFNIHSAPSMCLFWHGSCSVL